MAVNNEISNKLRDFLYVLMYMMSSKSKSLQLSFFVNIATYLRTAFL